MSGKMFMKPEMTIIEFVEDDVIVTSSCLTYVCPAMYGTSCGGICYDGNPECTGADAAP